MTDEHWAAITYAVERTERAALDSDWPAAVGTAKNLCESVAKIIIAARHAPTEGSEYPKIIRAAHATIDRLPGYGTAAEQPVREMASGAQKLVSALAELRNKVGDGHGQAAIPPTTIEHAGLAVDAALLWCRWALARLDHVLSNTVDRLIGALDSGEVFHAGTLTERLSHLGMNDLPDEDLFRLGRAVSHRGVHGKTFVVWNEGIGAAAIDPDAFPAPYRRGLVSGIFVDANGYVRSSPEGLQLAHKLVDSLDDTNFMYELARVVEGADFSYATDLQAAMSLAVVIDALANSMRDGALRNAWNRIGAKFATASRLLSDGS